MRRILLAVMIFGAAGAAHAQTPEVMDGVAAVVNSRVITYSEVRQYVQPAVRQLARDHSGDELVAKLHAAQIDALNTLIDRALIVDEYTEKGYQLPKNILDTQIDEIIATDFGDDRRAFIKTLEAEGMTMSQYREKLRERIIVQAMSARKLQQEVVVSPYQIEKYYQANIDEFREEDQIRLRMIYIAKTEPPPPPPPAEPKPEPEADAEAEPEPAAETEPAPWVDPNLKLAREIHAKLVEGDSFESLARLYSHAREADKGGDWGWIERDILMKQLSDVAFALKAGEYSDVVEAENGFYILFVEDTKPAHVRPLTEVRPIIEKIIQQDQRTHVQAEWVKELRARAYVRVF